MTLDTKNSDIQRQVDSILQLTQNVGESLNVAAEVLFILNGKRETLEEKMIKEILHKLCTALSQLLKTLHEFCLSDKLPHEKKIEEARALVEEIRLSVSELRKIARYDLNFLEQYFEYDYCAKLQNEHKFVERLEVVLGELSV